MCNLAKIRYFLIILLLFNAAGCVSLPETIPVGESEKLEVVSSFVEMAQSQSNCSCCIDAEASVTLKTFALSGAMQGFFQAMEPSYIKFVGLNILGQPTLLLASDGNDFQFVMANEAKAYAGPVNAQAFTDYAPNGFTPEFGFYWFSGRLSPGEIMIQSVAKDAGGAGYWVWFQRENSTIQYMVLVDINKKVINNLKVFENDSNVLDITYDDYTAGPCPLPGRMIAETGNSRSSLEFVFSWEKNVVSFSKKDFSIRIPRGFQRISVK